MRKNKSRKELREEPGKESFTLEDMLILQNFQTVESDLLTSTPVEVMPIWPDDQRIKAKIAERIVCTCSNVFVYCI